MLIPTADQLAIGKHFQVFQDQVKALVSFAIEGGGYGGKSAAVLGQAGNDIGL
jgi:hypothetical protein